MKKEIESKLKELAISILNNDSKTPVNTLKAQASLLYERLTILAYAEEKAVEDIIIKTVITEPKVVKKEDILIEAPKAIKNPEPPAKPIIELSEPFVPEPAAPDLLFELDELTAGFENLPEFEPAQESETFVQEEKKKNIVEGTPSNINSSVPKSKSSLNDSLKSGINIGLNDRLAFVKHLFDNNQDDYTRVISQLNTLESKSGALNFIQQIVKPEYNNWQGKDAFEERFINAVFSKFEL